MLKHENFRCAFVCSKSTIETLKQGMKYVQSYELRHYEICSKSRIKIPERRQNLVYKNV